MSAEATGWVYRHSPYSGAEFAVHLAIADSVNDQHDNRFWMAQGNLARKIRADRRTVQRALPTMVTDGFLEVLDASKGQTVLYRFVFKDDAEVVHDTRGRGVRQDVAPSEGDQDVAGGATSDRTGGVISPHKPKKNPSEPKRREPVNGVPPPTEDVAARLLGEFAEIDAEALPPEEVKRRNAEAKRERAKAKIAAPPDG